MDEASEVPSIDTILSNIKDFFCRESDSTREQIIRLDEQSLRSLRDQLHSQLVDEFPATAGRPLTKRMPGNVTKLADDCWAFGASLAQGILLKEADCVLKPPDRRAQAVALQSSSATPLTAADIGNMEAILNNMTRLDREVQNLQASEIKLREIMAAQQVRIASLEERAARCGAHDNSVGDGETSPASSDAPSTADRSAPGPAATTRRATATGTSTQSGEHCSKSTSLAERRDLRSSSGEPAECRDFRSSAGETPECRHFRSSAGEKAGTGSNQRPMANSSVDSTVSTVPDTSSRTTASTVAPGQPGFFLPSEISACSSEEAPAEMISSTGGNIAVVTKQVTSSSHSGSALAREARRSEKGRSSTGSPSGTGPCC